MKKILLVLLCACIFLSAAGCEITIDPKSGVSGKTAESSVYPGVKYESAFGVFAERVEKINSGYIAGGISGLPTETMDMYKNMDVEEYIEDWRKKYEEFGLELDEAMIEELRKGFLAMQDYLGGGALDTTEGEEDEPDAAYSPFGGFFLKDIPDNDAIKEYDPENTAEWALGVAGDMAAAQLFGVYDPGLIKAGGLAVSVYPHPLVLNNYASLLCNFSPIDALFFYFGALEYEPENPVILCNIAFCYYDIGDLDSAIAYADIAIKNNPECGPAYQLKTLGHLRDGNSELATETLFKSARDCFDEMTMTLFEAYIDEVESFSPWWHGHDDIEECRCLWPEDDQFPITEVTLELLYEISRKYVDTEDINPNVDTPSAQLNFAEYPAFGGAEDYMFSIQDYWGELVNENYKESDKAIHKVWELEDKLGIPYGLGPKSEAETLQVQNNLRQYYAFKVLLEYYTFLEEKLKADTMYSENRGIDFITYKTDDLQRKFQADLKSIFIPNGDAIIALREQGDERVKDLKKQYEDLSHEHEINCHHNMGPVDPAKCKSYDERFEALRKQIKETELRNAIEIRKQKQVYMNEMYNVSKAYAQEIWDMNKDLYNAEKQIFEEFWLKAGGIMKYITDPDVMELCENEREYFLRIYSDIEYFRDIEGGYNPVGFIEDEKYNFALGYEYWQWGTGKYTVEFYYESYNKWEDEIEELEAELYALLEQNRQKEPNYMTPPEGLEFKGSPIDIEKNALRQFENNGEMRGISVGDYYYRFSSTESEWKLPWSEGKYDKESGQKITYDYEQGYDIRQDFQRLPASVYDADAVAVKPGDLASKAKAFGQKLEEQGGNINMALSAASKVFAPVAWVKETADTVSGIVGIARAGADVKSAGDIRKGSYVTRDSKNRVIDQGAIYERQVGGEIKDFGLNRTTTVMRSKMTGVTSKNKTLTYKYKFLTYTE